MNTIIFVCTGNTCRSPMAEMIMDDLLKKSNIKHIVVYSRGISAFNSAPAATHVQTLLSLQNIDASSHCSKLLSQDDFTKNTLILTMTLAHKQHVDQYFPKYAHQVHTLAEYVTGSHKDIADPYGGSIDLYRQCYLQLESFLTKLIKNLPTL